MGAINVPANYGANRQTWAISLYPFLEQQAVYDRFDPDLVGGGRACWCMTSNSQGPSAVTGVVVSGFFCPSDGMGGKIQTSVCGDLMKSNYMAFFGDIAHDNGIPPNESGAVSPPNKRAAFGINFGARFADITDGSSNSMAFGEYLTGASETDNGNDARGPVWADEAGESQIYTQFTPNSSNPDVLYPGYCINLPQENLPCVDGTNETAASRSRHAGGVNVTMCDGAVRFISENIDIDIWQALGSIDNGGKLGNLGRIEPLVPVY